MRTWFLLASCFVLVASDVFPAAGDDTYLVFLKEPSVVDKVLESAPSEAPVSLRRQMLSSAAAAAYRSTLESSQKRTVASLSAGRPGPGPGGGASALRLSTPRIEVLSSRTFLVNMLVVRCGTEGLEELRGHPGVRAVYPNFGYRVQMDTTPSLVGATSVWEMLGGLNSAGSGIRIAVIDTGLNQAHPMLKDASLTPPPGFPRPFEFVAFTSGKVIVARDYVKPDYGYAAQDVHSPQDEWGHGTQVASIAAGAWVTTPWVPISGMAPKAYLGNYKVFGKPGVNDSAPSAALVAALSDAVEDGMDIVNLSVGNVVVFLPADDPVDQAIEAATKAGTLVTVPAGNDGPYPGTIHSPGTSPAALTVGATLHDRYFASGVSFASTDPGFPASLALVRYVLADGQTIKSDLGPYPVTSILKYDPTAQCCSPLPAGSLSGKMALIRRGGCTFAIKANNAANAGALGIIVYNNADGIPWIMLEVDPSRPAVMIEKTPGEALQAFLASHSATVILHPDSKLYQFFTQSDLLASFTSRGPNVSLDLKPDLVAPGQGILSASGTSGYSTCPSGTSYSTPVITGAAALILQLHPNWTPEAVKSSLVNTAERVTTWNGQLAAVIHTGNGRVNVQKASAASVMVNPVSVSFGAIQEAAGQELQRTLEVRNLSTTTSQTISGDLVETQSHPSAQVSLSPLALTLAPGQSGLFVLTVRVVAPVHYGTFEGYLRFTGAPSASPLTAPYWGGFPVQDPSRLLKVSQSGNQGYSSIMAALMAARPGATVELQDSANYAERLSLNANQDGLPLHGLTLRSRPGQSPVIATPEGELGLTVVGIQGITIDGLRVQKANAGVFSVGSSGRILNTSVDTGRYGMWFDNSQFALANDSISQAAKAGIVANYSRLNVDRTTVSGSGEEGLSMAGSAALVQRSVFSSNLKPGFVAADSFVSLFDSTIEKNSTTGLRLTDTIGLIKGGVVRDTSGTDADGVETTGAHAALLVQDSEIVNHPRYGVRAASSAHVDLFRNQVRDNHSAGFYLTNGTAFVGSSWFLGNGAGVTAQSAQLEIADSVIAGSMSASGGDGIWANQVDLTARNLTVARNQGKGLRIENPTYLLLANSILWQNAKGDLAGAQPEGVKTNVIGDGTFAGTNGNLKSDPLFRAPDQNDFSLTAGSPAVDASGPDAQISLLDASSHERVIDGNGDGQARADLGALEHVSKTWLPLILPILSTRPDEFVGLALVNSSSQTAHVELRAFDTGGHAVGGLCEKDIKPGTQISLLLTEAFGPLQPGWVEITADKPDLLGFSILGNGALTQMDGAQLSRAAASRLLFPEIRAEGSGETSMFVVNPNPEPVTVLLKWVRPAGTSAKEFVTPARGSLTYAFTQLFGTSEGGYVEIEARDQKSGEAKAVFAMELFTNGKSLAGLLGLDMDWAADTLFGAQLASSPAVETILNVVNAGSSVVDLTLQAFDEAGSLVKSASAPGLAPGAQFRKTAKEIFGFTKDMVGWVRISTAKPALVGCLTFSDTAGSFMASLPLQSEGAREFVLGHVAQTADVFTGVTVLNASSIPAQVSLEVFDRDGVSQGISLFELRSQEKRARLLPEYLPGFGQHDSGFVRVRSNLPIFGFELFGQQQLKFMSAVPQQVVVY